MIKNKLFLYLKIDTTWIDSFSKFNRHGACAECNLPPKHLLDGHSQDLRYSPVKTGCFNALINWIRIKMVLLMAWIQKWYLWNEGYCHKTELVSATQAKHSFPTELLGVYPHLLTTCPSFIITEMEIKEPPSPRRYPFFSHIHHWRKGVWKTGLNVETVWRLGNLDWQVIQMCLKTKGIFGNFQVQGATPTLQQLLFGCHEGWCANVFRAQNAPLQKASKAEIRQLPWCEKNHGETLELSSPQGNDWMDTSHLVTWYFHPSKTLKNDPGLEN